jgi:hypothetical protein
MYAHFALGIEVATVRVQTTNAEDCHVQTTPPHVPGYRAPSAASFSCALRALIAMSLVSLGSSSVANAYNDLEVLVAPVVVGQPAALEISGGSSLGDCVVGASTTLDPVLIPSLSRTPFFLSLVHSLRSPMRRRGSPRSTSSRTARVSRSRRSCSLLRQEQRWRKPRAPAAGRC